MKLPKLTSLLIAATSLLPCPALATDPPTADFAPPAAAPLEPAPSQAPVPAAEDDPRRRFDLAADVGVGLLEFFHLDLVYLPTGRQLARRLAFGAGVGGFPLDKALSAVMETDDLAAEAELAGITLAGDVATELVSFRLFGRWFPWRKLFFGELTIEAWRLRVRARGTVDSADYGELIEVKAGAEVWVPMIGLHGGWRFLWKSGAYLEIAGGVNALLSPGAEVTLGGTTIEQLEAYPEARAALEDARRFLSAAVEDGANRITAKVKVFPTGSVRFGWAFDAW